ncbi:MAG: hemolysin family protein [Oscillospiraceae bacterium]
MDPFLIAFFILLAVDILAIAGGLAWYFLIHRRNKSAVSEDEIRAMVDIGEEKGAIESGEKEMIENIFEFNNTTAEDIMVHRTDMVLIRAAATTEEIIGTIEESGLSRFPVYDEDADDIIGTLSTRDYLLNERHQHPKPLCDILRPAYFVPESVRTDLLLRDMQTKKIHIAIIVDEYGGTSGLVTMEDLLEEIVGDIYDEFDHADEAEIIPLEENLWRVAGGTELEDLAEALEIDLDEAEEYDTLGGLVLAQLSVIPAEDSHVEVDACGLHIKVESLIDRRIEWALVSKLEPKPQET